MRVLSLILCCSLVCVLSGCNGMSADPDFRDTEGYNEENGFSASLTLDFEELQKKYPVQQNDICYYIMAQNQMPEERNVKFCFTDIYANGWREARTMEITSKGIGISDERVIDADT